MRGSFTTSLQNVLEDEPTQETNDNENSNSQDLGKSHEQFVEQQAPSNNDASSQSTDDTTTNNNNYRPRARRPNRHLHGKSGRMNKSLVQSLKFDSIFSSQTTRNSSSCPSNMQNHESINIMDFGVSEDKFNASFNLSDPSNAASGVTSPSSNASNNMSYLVDSDNFMGWNGSKGNESSLSNLVDSQGFLNWNAADSQEEVAEGDKSKEEEDTTADEDKVTITPIEDEHGGKLSKSSSTSSTENVLTKQMKRLSSTLSTATKRSSWDTNGSRRASEELSDIEDNESFAMPRFNKEDEHVDIGELRKDLIAAAKKESDEGGGKKNTLLKRVSTLLEQSG